MIRGEFAPSRKQVCGRCRCEPTESYAARDAFAGFGPEAAWPCSPL